MRDLAPIASANFLELFFNYPDDGHQIIEVLLWIYIYSV